MQSAGSRRGKDSSACHLRNRAAKIPKQRGKQGKSSKKRKKKENSVTMHNGPKRQGCASGRSATFCLPTATGCRLSS